MRKFLLLAALLVSTMQLFAAQVDLSQAQAAAQRFLQNRALPASGIRLQHAEMSSTRLSQPVYYIFNSDNAFVIVSGDDRAQEILGYGDKALDMNNMPENMKFWLGTYKEQLEYLQAHPDLEVEKSASRANGGVSVAPMLEAMWNQGYPYYSQCPMIESASVRAQTGCAATSLAQVFYYWKYPNFPTPVIPGYTTKTYGLVLEALPSVTFDWDNILPTYNFGDYTQNDEHHRAIAQLMRYIGQAEHMDYTDKFGEADEVGILNACHTFGYVNAQVAYKSILYSNGVDSVYIDDDTWEEMLQGELVAGRPVVYCAVSYSSAYDGYYGHAFNVDGYNANDGKYSINWGWSGTGNGYFALHAFSNQGNNYTLNQLMVMGIEPPEPIECSDPVMLPADSAHIALTSFRANWTDETPDENVISYTLEVNPGDGSNHGVYEKVFSESFSKCTSSGSSAITKFDNYCDNSGWTGSYAYEANGGLRLGSSSRTGSITTPALDMTQSGGKMTVIATIKPYSSDTNVPVRISCGSSMVNLTITENAPQTIILDCVADENQKVTIATTEAGKRVVVTNVDIYSSTNESKMSLRAVTETGDSTMRVITGITDKFYTVSGLTAGGTFNYKVKAHFVNGTQSAWSNLEVVTLFDNSSAHNYEPGDANHDHLVDIEDVTLLINDLLYGTSAGCTTCGDLNGDGKVDIEDVTALINILLYGPNR
ncbi:MAG: C10 family peptidase [Muribaculaceae bacterium]|nr:C10 family peptidase [Muribaculaceae bacterium]